MLITHRSTLYSLLAFFFLFLLGLCLFFFSFFFFNDTATTEIYTLSLHDALPISLEVVRRGHQDLVFQLGRAHDRRREADAFDEGLDVLLPFGRAAFLEVAEVDVGAAERVGVFQPDFAFVVRIGLEDDPAEAIVSLAPRSVRRLLALEVARVTLFIAPEVARQAENEQVGDAVLCLGGALDDGHDHAVARIDATMGFRPGVEDVVALGRRVVSAERTLLARAAQHGAFAQRDGLS